MKLSIITINYNNRDGLQRTIDSVICQTWRDFEWIVIDGGSTDGSKELIESYKSHFSYWCSEPDNGIYNAMNKGIDHAKGDYLLFLNSGDAFYKPDTLSNVFSRGLHSDLISGVTVRADNGKPRRGYYDSIVRQLIVGTIEHQGTFIKRELFKSYKYREDFKIVSDWAAWIEWILKQNCTFEYIDEIIATQEIDGISAVQTDMLNKERSITLNDYFGERIVAELNHLWTTQDQMKEDLWHPAIKGLVYLKENKSKLFGLYHFLIRISIFIYDFVFRTSSYSEFVQKRDY